ncbi:hypothetical protein ANN_26314 [Periplaneta americana]|uniref:Uncharacterized protein n=1 Tax=Periplaneta americana TaxID=6978 RepID=A0ABQ8S5X4_PERAM|nr:hypothetical protein ANN_26314 [Periplaneta americana]
MLQRTLWTNANIALGWIRSDPSRLKTFVSNRVTKIQAHITPSQWRHCLGKDNPADHLTRGITAFILLILSEWWNGPNWLRHHQSQWPSTPSQQDSTLPEAKQHEEVLRIEIALPVIDATRFSSYWRLIRVTAWMLRFIKNIRDPQKVRSDLTAKELDIARL